MVWIFFFIILVCFGEAGVVSKAALTVALECPQGFRIRGLGGGQQGIMTHDGILCVCVLSRQVVRLERDGVA